MTKENTNVSTFPGDGDELYVVKISVEIQQRCLTVLGASYLEKKKDISDQGLNNKLYIICRKRE